MSERRRVRIEIPASGKPGTRVYLDDQLVRGLVCVTVRHHVDDVCPRVTLDLLPDTIEIVGGFDSDVESRILDVTTLEDRYRRYSAAPRCEPQ